jgi:hypothetical protein
LPRAPTKRMGFIGALVLPWTSRAVSGRQSS